MTAKDNIQVHQIICIEQKQIVSAKLSVDIKVSIRDSKSLSDRDLIFKLTVDDIYSQFVNADMKLIKITNNSNQPIIYNHHMKLEKIVDYDKVDCQLTEVLDPEEAESLKEELSEFRPLKTQLVNEVTIYRDIRMVNLLESLLEEFSKL